jgi:signal transduction histidine kinase/DNA-binding response OmpR family regulator
VIDVAERANELCQSARERLWVRTDRLFAGLLLFQWLAAIAAAQFVSPRTWSGALAETHLHVYAAIGLGGLLAIVPLLLVWHRPGQTLTRHAIAFAQVSFSSLLIHLTGGRIETHFHVFGSLAFLAFYRHWPVLVTATTLVAFDHLVRGLYWPQSVFGVLTASNWRWLEHAGWVLFEDVFLVYSCRLGNSEMREIALRQAELEITNDRIERVVAERTRELEEARDRALESTRVKSQFLANMSHEIRTPMNGVLGFVDLLLDTELTAEQRSYLATVRASGDALVNIVNDVLDFSKIEADRLILDARPFDLRRTVELVGDLLACQAEKKWLELVCRVPPDAPAKLVGDEHRIRQILLNLVGNAVKFTEQGEVELSTAITRRGDGSALVRFAVRDTGIGIPAAQRERVFEAFTQVDGTHSRPYEGTGLGLAICRRLVERMGGTIACTSEVGGGSTFTVELVLPCADEPRTDEPWPQLRGLSMLIVAESAACRRSLVDLLAAVGCHVVEAGGFDAGLLAMRERSSAPFDLVICDLRMVDQKGASFAARARAELAIDRVPMLLLTTISCVDAREIASQGYAGHVTKPVKRRELLVALSDVVSRARSGSPRAAAGDLDWQSTRLPAQRILLAEDNPVNQRLVLERLRRLGHETEVASNGAEAVAAARARSFDLILMDVQMPEMDGFAATRAIRALEASGDRTPIIALTAHALAGDRDRCLAMGMDDYLSKPVRAEDLESVLARWGRRRTDVASAVAAEPVSHGSR